MDFYVLDKELLFYLRKKSLILDQQINSRLSYFISKIIEDGIPILTSPEKQALKDIITSFYRHRDSSTILQSYCGTETWRYIRSFTFGQTVKMIEKLDSLIKKRGMKESVMPSVAELQKVRNTITLLTKSQLEEHRDFRNFACHNVPLSVYLTKKYRYSLRKNTVRYLINNVDDVSINDPIVYYRELASSFFRLTDKYRKDNNIVNSAL